MFLQEKPMKKILIVAIILLTAVSGWSAPADRWVKGHTHTHTNQSDGDEYPQRVARWYRDHGYNFLFITDHDMITSTLALDADGNRDDFIVIPGD